MKIKNMATAVALIVCLMSCNEKTPVQGYIGPSDIEIQDGQMTPEVLLSLGRLSGPCLSPDGRTILYGVSYTDIDENRSCRNLFLINADGSHKRQLTREGKSISNACWLPGGKKIAYLQGGQIWTAEIRGLDSDNPLLIRKTKLSDVPNGISEFKISPDFSKVLYISTIKAGAQRPTDINPRLSKADAYSTEELMYRHWDHWVTEVPRTYVADFKEGICLDNSKDLIEGEPARVELPTEPFGGAEQFAWSPDSRHIAYSCRKKTGKEYAFSTNTEIYIYTIEGAQTKAVTCGGGYDTDPVWSPDGRTLAWLSMERDGYEADKTRLMAAEISPELGIGQAKDITADFKYNAGEPAWIGNTLYFTSLTEGLQGIFKVVDGKIERVSGEGIWRDFHSPFAMTENGLLATWCSMDFPTEIVLVSPDGEPAQIGDENGHILRQLKPTSIEAVKVKTVDGKDMLTWVVYPPEFDPAKTYPAIEILLGGPQGTLSQGWSYRWNYRLMASQGYVVVLPNRRGTTAFGQEWTEQISGDYIGLNMQDYLCAARYIKSQPYIGKIAACGASYGGFSAYYLAGIHENTYDCFIAHAGIFDERYMYFETEEMWFPNWDNGGLEEYGYTPGEMGPRGDGKTFGGMRQGGSPWSDNPKARRHYANSPSMNVEKWNKPILCIHGELDYRIPYDQGMAAFNCAQMMGVPSRLVVFPGECHWILKPQNAMLWHTEYFSWLERWCK